MAYFDLPALWQQSIVPQVGPFGGIGAPTTTFTNPFAPPTPTPGPGGTPTPNQVAPSGGGTGAFQIGGGGSTDSTGQQDSTGTWFFTDKKTGRTMTGDGKPYTPVSGFRAPQTTSSTSSSTSTSYQDPAYLKYLTDQAAVTKTQKDRELQISQGNLDFLQRKQDFEESIGRSAEARQTQAQVFSQQATVAQLQSQVMQANAQLQSTTDQFNATQRMAVDKGNADFESAKQDRLQSLATNIGTLAADPGDRGKYAATILANSGWGQQPAATTGTDLRTNTSLTPLQGLLDLRTNTQNSKSPFSYNPVAAPTVSMPSLPTPWNGTSTNVSSSAANGSISSRYGGELSGSNAADAFAGNATQSSFVQALLAAGYTPQALPSNNGVPQEKNGGAVNAQAYVSGEAGPELNIPLGEGQALVIPKNKVSAKQWASLTKMATGGIFDNGSVFGGGDTSGALSFLQQASQVGRQGTPWETGPLPSATYASTPGFDPIVANLIASLQAQENGLPQASFLRNAALLTPNGLPQSPIRRAA